MTEFQLNEEYAGLLNRMAADYLAGRLTDREGPASPGAGSVRPIQSRVMALLEPLDSGSSAKARYLSFTQRPAQMVTIPIDAADGNFKLHAGGPVGFGNPADPDLTSGDIPWNATAEQMQAAIAEIDLFGPNEVRVTLGDAFDAAGTRFHTGRWFLEFLATDNPPLLAPFQEEGQPLIDATNETHFLVAAAPPLDDTVWGILPIEKDDQKVPAGAIVTVDWFEGRGWGAVTAECKDGLKCLCEPASEEY